LPKEVEFPQVTQDQIEIWLAGPVTKAYLRCLEWKTADTRDAAGDGRLTDSMSADLTHALLHRALGQQDGYKEAGKPETLLQFYKIVFIPPPKEEPADAAA
jgi:hypothetical protein